MLFLLISEKGYLCNPLIDYFLWCQAAPPFIAMVKHSISALKHCRRIMWVSCPVIFHFVFLEVKIALSLKHSHVEQEM